MLTLPCPNASLRDFTLRAQFYSQFHRSVAYDRVSYVTGCARGGQASRATFCLAAARQTAAATSPGKRP